VQRIVLSSLLLQYLLVIWKWDGITVSFFQFCLEYFFLILCLIAFAFAFASFPTSLLPCIFAFLLLRFSATSLLRFSASLLLYLSACLLFPAFFFYFSSFL